jgi:DNA-binding response OmpR family regulator
MPQMSGRELVLRLTSVRPEMRVLFMSGYTEKAGLHHGILESGIAYLQKPFTPETLSRRVRQVLDSRRG